MLKIIPRRPLRKREITILNYFVQYARTAYIQEDPILFLEDSDNQDFLSLDETTSGGTENDVTDLTTDYGFTTISNTDFVPMTNVGHQDGNKQSGINDYNLGDDNIIMGKFVEYLTPDIIGNLHNCGLVYPHASLGELHDHSQHT